VVHISVSLQKPAPSLPPQTHFFKNFFEYLINSMAPSSESKQKKEKGEPPSEAKYKLLKRKLREVQEVCILSIRFFFKR